MLLASCGEARDGRDEVRVVLCQRSLTNGPDLGGRLLSAEARGAALPQDGSPRHAASGRPAARAAQVLGGRGVRLALLTASLAAGLVIALLTVHLAGPWQSPGKLFLHP